MKSNFKEMIFNRIGSSETGYLSYIESLDQIPFEIKRVYYTYETPVNTIRGFHAHIYLEQVAFCPYGKIEILLDSGKEKSIHLLDSPEKGLYIGNGFWREMKWLKKDSVLCVIASEKYDKDDYIRDYKEFKKMVDEGFWDDKKK